MSAGADWAAPRATLRMQFHKGFTFDDAARRAPYLAALGISHLYASPILTARKGSTHGYDVVDPTEINPELGGEAGFRRLVAALRREQLGIIVDIVPNHMAVVGGGNAWWDDVLARGALSPYAKFFDIDWSPADESLRGKVLLPTLGRPYGEALAEGEITLAFDATRDRYEARYFENVFPISPRDRVALDQAGLEAFDAKTSEGAKRLHELLERQNYRLAWHQSANDVINWRRFFDINELAALRAEDEEVFEATHATLFALFADGFIDGFRVDHIDGLTDPAAYCRRLRARMDQLWAQRGLAGRPYLVVEKILGRDEALATDWGVDGTTGYDFMNDVSAVLHDPAGEAPLGRLWRRLSGRTDDFAQEEEASRREMLGRGFASQLGSAVAALARLAAASPDTRDLGAPAIERVLVEILAHLRVYRTYDNTGSKALTQAVEKAQVACLPRDRDTLRRVADWLGGGGDASADLKADALRKFRQLSAPLAAKAVEDTAFYRYGRLLSRVDVGFDPADFALSAEAFHARCDARRRDFPSAMLATATHDHKRGEDMRARLSVLSAMPDIWAGKLADWVDRLEPLRAPLGEASAPSRGDIAMLLQTIIGAWPFDLSVDDAQAMRAFAERVAGWQLKAMREAKLATDWATPHSDYEDAARAFTERLLAGEDPDLLADIAAFAGSIAPAGAAAGLAQTLLKLTAPGVPDTYQGTEFWDLSLVDPDNRRPVDYDSREASLRDETPLAELIDKFHDGRVKQHLIRRALARRRSSPNLFTQGAYQPLNLEGPLAERFVAFAREDGASLAITVVCTRPAGLPQGLKIALETWRDTRLCLPERYAGTTLVDALTGASIVAERRLDVADLLTSLPVALLITV